MPATAQVPMALRSWLKGQYPTLALSDSWLTSTVSDFTGARSGADTELIKYVNEALLSSDLAAVSERGCLPPSAASGDDDGEESKLAQGPRGALLLQITAKLDIGLSAQAQLDVLEARKAARTTAAGRAALASSDAEQANDAYAQAHAQTQPATDHMADFNASEEAASLPATVFPRSILQLKLSDGFTTITAFEHRRVPALSMGDTPLGAKLLLRDVRVRGGQILLTPGSVVYKGGKIEALDKDAEDRLIDQLRAKLGKPPLRAARARTQPAAERGGASASASAGAHGNADIPLLDDNDVDVDDDAFAEEEAILAELDRQQRVTTTSTGPRRRSPPAPSPASAPAPGPAPPGNTTQRSAQRDGNTSRFFSARVTRTRTEATGGEPEGEEDPDSGQGDGIGSSFFMDLDEDERALTGAGAGAGSTTTTNVAQEGFIILERNDPGNPIVLSDSE